MKPKLSDINDWTTIACKSKYNVAKAAKICGVTVRALEAFFLRTTGITPHEWMRELRLMEAHGQLRTGRYSVKETAYSFGYRQPSHFSADFKSYFGIPPSQACSHAPGAARLRTS